ncbi:hypothetical protein [Streptomyces sp. NPDC006879]|uniref:hypothetical protein n=1 Tax=Streptomyces sp. NPDC006879 TaxID=3364767 RepID=UPI0036C38130
MSDQYVPSGQAVDPPATREARLGAGTVEAGRAWISGFPSDNPWQAKLCLETEQGIATYPLTPHTMPDLLAGLVEVAQAQQGATGPVTEDDSREEDPEVSGPSDPEHPGGLHEGRAARLTGWAVVHELWEREDPKARFIMGALVISLLVLGVFLS